MNAKEQAFRVVDQLPDDATWDDVLHEFYICQQVASGMQDIVNGRTVSDEDARKEFLK